MWEMLYKCVTGEYQRPYAEYTYITQPFQIIIQVFSSPIFLFTMKAAQRGLRPTIPIADKCPQPFVTLINACWDSGTYEKVKIELNLLQTIQNVQTQSKFWLHWNNAKKTLKKRKMNGILAFVILTQQLQR